MLILRATENLWERRAETEVARNNTLKQRSYYQCLLCSILKLHLGNKYCLYQRHTAGKSKPLATLIQWKELKSWVFYSFFLIFVCGGSAMIGQRILSSSWSLSSSLCPLVIRLLLSFFLLPACEMLSLAPGSGIDFLKYQFKRPWSCSETALHTKWRCLLLSSQSPVNVHITKPQHLIVSDWLSLLSLNSQAWVSQGTLLPFIPSRVVQARSKSRSIIGQEGTGLAHNWVCSQSEQRTSLPGDAALQRPKENVNT